MYMRLLKKFFSTGNDNPEVDFKIFNFLTRKIQILISVTNFNEPIKVRR